MIINFNNRQQKFSSYLWTLSFKNLTCLCTSYLKMTQLSIYSTSLNMQTKPIQFFPSLPNKNFTFYLKHLNLVSYTGFFCAYQLVVTYIKHLTFQFKQCKREAVLFAYGLKTEQRKPHQNQHDFNCLRLSKIFKKIL